MTYKVFLVEDEIVTREGIRDNVNWEEVGFEFCGEAPDGEIALPLIEKIQPDVLITDIKMPFMDGLQLSKIIREHMPWIKTIILSGHNEFEYAQSAVKLGVTEYLLKPVSAQDLLQVLKNLYKVLEKEKEERENLKHLQDEMQDSLSLSRENFLLKLVMGGVSSSEALEKSQQLGLDIIARYYLILIVRIELCDGSQPYSYLEYKKVENIISELSTNNQKVLMTKKDPEEIVLLLKGESQEELVQEGKFLSGLIKNEVEGLTDCAVVVVFGKPRDRLGEIHHSFTQAMVMSKSDSSLHSLPEISINEDTSYKVDHQAIENFIKFGSIQDFNDFYNTTIDPFSKIVLRSNSLKHYLFLDIILTANQFMSDLGGETNPSSLSVYKIEKKLTELDSQEKIRQELKTILTTTLKFRDSQTYHERTRLLRLAKSFIDDNFSNPDIKLDTVANKFNISSSYFSSIFSKEFGTTFRDYVSSLKLNKAKELLRTTNLKCSEVAFQCGYNDSHYFSFVFKKKTGVSPQEFRSQPLENP